MTTTDLERRLAAVLHERAERAMRETHTEERLQVLLDRGGHNAGRRRWVMGAVAAAAVAVVALVVALSPWEGSDESRSILPASPQPAVEVAEGFIRAFGAYDTQSVVGYLGDATNVSIWSDSTGAEVWRKGHRFLAAMDFRILDNSCLTGAQTVDGTTVTCVFAYHALGSEELGRGPFGDNTFRFTVDEGQIKAVEMSLAYGTNGFSTQMWEPFAKWIASEHPDEASVMYADWPQQTLEALSAEAAELWAKNRLEYIRAELSGR